MNDPNKMGIRIGFNRSGPPTRPGLINVIGSGSNMNQQGMQQMVRPPAPKENVIQVMTADRREYSRTVVSNKFELPPPSFNPNPEDLIYHHENDAFNYGYEPTQDSQWEGNPGWAPSDIKELTPGQPNRMPQMVPPVMGMPGPMGMPMPGPMGLPPPMGMPIGMPMNRNMMPGDKDRERDDRRGDKNDVSFFANYLNFSKYLIVLRFETIINIFCTDTLLVLVVLNVNWFRVILNLSLV